MVDPATAAADTPAEACVSALADAYDHLQSVEAEIDDIGEQNIEAAADGYRNATRLLNSYEDTAVGTGDFGAYLTFQNQFLSLVSQLPDAAMAAEGFQRASDRMDKRRLNESDFAFARDAIEPASEAVDLLERRETAVDAYRSARHDVKTRKKELKTERKRLDRLQTLGDVDLDVSLAPVREPIEAYNDALVDAFETFRNTQPARALFELLDAGADRPLVGVDRPPRDLADYIHDAPAGEEPLSTLREYADYSSSKLEHYVDDPGALRTHVAVHQTYLDRLSPKPLEIEWPPAESGVLRARLQELAPIVRRLDSATDSTNSADEPAVESADESAVESDTDDSLEYYRRQLARLTRSDEYDRLRQVAVADAELDDEEFDRVASGAIEDDLAAVEAGLQAVDDALDAYEIE